MAKKESKFPYTTHVGLVLDVDRDGDDWLCTITGDRTKELKRGSMGVVMAEAQRWWAHYEERKVKEAAGANVNTG